MQRGKLRVLLVGRTRYRLPLDSSLRRKFDALREVFELRVLGSAPEGAPTSDDTFHLVPFLKPRRLDGLAFHLGLPFRVAREVTAMANTLGGLECLVFTGGIGEHSKEIRQQVCDRLRWLGVAMDHAANDQASETISAENSEVEILIVPASEETTIARYCSAKLSA